MVQIAAAAFAWLSAKHGMLWIMMRGELEVDWG